MGGENRVRRSVCHARRGSSPRGRGKLGARRFAGRLVWLIPAWAGKTCTPPRWASHPQAHPRVGGENSWWSALPCHAAGSSPRGRGKPAGRQGHPRGRRLIPAWAGKTRGFRGTTACVEAHPRVGGENYYRDVHAFVDQGSSPRGRGKHMSANLAANGRRLIPAWAGKTKKMSRHST